MKAATQRRILTLASQGQSAQAIADATDTALRAVVKFLDAHPEEPDDQEERDELGAVVAETRQSAIDSARHIQKLMRDLAIEMEPGKMPARELRDSIVAYGIMVDKVPVILRTLRSLEAEAVDDIETGWTVVVRED